VLAGGWKQHPNDPAEQRGVDKLKVIELSNWGADAGIDIPIDTLGQYPELNPKTATSLYLGRTRSPFGNSGAGLATDVPLGKKLRPDVVLRRTCRAPMHLVQ